MVSEQFHRPVFVAIIEHRTIIRAQHDDGLLRKPESINGSENLTDAPIEF
jgi:hypothetical protein